MKRFVTVALAGLLCIGSLDLAQAENNIDVKIRGEWDFAFGWAENTSFAGSRQMGKRGERDDDNFMARQRVRTQINFIISENLQSVLMFEIGETNWGRDTGEDGYNEGGGLGADGVNVKTKFAYLDWMVPDSDLHIRMGLQPLALPSATELGSPVMGDDDGLAAIVANYAFTDSFGLTAFWARPYNLFLNDTEADNGRHYDDEMDMFGLVAQVSLDGLTITPWGVVAAIGSASGYFENLLNMTYRDPFDVTPAGYSMLDSRGKDSSIGWWVGLGTNVDVWDPLTFSFDVLYGSVGATDVTTSDYDTNGNLLASTTQKWEASGWFIDARLDYALDWGTAGIFGWWSSGDDAKDRRKGKLGRMPIIGPQGFGPTSFGFDGAFGIADGAIVSNTGIGTWGLGVQIADMSFYEDLSHTVRFSYYRGTNDHEILNNHGAEGPAMQFGDGWYMTDKDYAFEVNFDHTYQIYENLAAVLELGYIHMHLDKEAWRNVGPGYNKTDGAWKAQLSFQYTF